MSIRSSLGLGTGSGGPLCRWAAAEGTPETQIGLYVPKKAWETRENERKRLRTPPKSHLKGLKKPFKMSINGPSPGAPSAAVLHS